MEEKARGVVLRLYPLTETSLIVRWLAAEQGRISTVAKGARRPKSPFRGKLDLFYLADFTFARSRRSELHTLREVSLLDTHPSLRQDLDCLRQASYCTALIEQATEAETPLPNIYALLTGMLKHLSDQPPRPQTIFAFELKLLGELGLTPDLAKGSLTAGAQSLVSALTENDWESVGRIQLSAVQTTEIARYLHGFLIYHLGKIPKGRNAAIG